MSRILKTGKNQVTCGYNVVTHRGIDIVKYKASLDYIVAHSAGTVVEVVKNYNRTDKSGGSYGNYVRIKHDNGYYTLYAHMKYGSVTVSKGQRVSKGQVIGYMGNTGYSKGAHVHFEVRNKLNIRINPTPYVDADLPGTSSSKEAIYRVHSYNDKKWYAEAKNGTTAGNLSSKIDGLQVKTSNAGEVRYKAHIKGGKWLDSVYKWDSTDNGYSGIIGKPIDAIAIWSEKGTIMYRVHTKKYGWLAWVTKYDTSRDDGYAGVYGHEIDGVQIKFK